MSGCSFYTSYEQKHNKRGVFSESFSTLPDAGNHSLVGGMEGLGRARWGATIVEGGGGSSIGGGGATSQGGPGEVGLLFG